MIAGNPHPLFLWKNLKQRVVEYHDSYVPVVPPTREHAHFNGKQSVLIEDTYDLILLSTDHSEYKDSISVIIRVPLLIQEIAFKKDLKNTIRLE